MSSDHYLIPQPLSSYLYYDGIRSVWFRCLAFRALGRTCRKLHILYLDLKSIFFNTAITQAKLACNFNTTTWISYHKY